jgi:hypothetical protein
MNTTALIALTTLTILKTLEALMIQGNQGALSILGTLATLTVLKTLILLMIRMILTILKISTSLQTRNLMVLRMIQDIIITRMIAIHPMDTATLMIIIHLMSIDTHTGLTTVEVDMRTNVAANTEAIPDRHTHSFSITSRTPNFAVFIRKILAKLFDRTPEISHSRNSVNEPNPCLGGKSHIVSRDEMSVT